MKCYYPTELLSPRSVPLTGCARPPSFNVFLHKFGKTCSLVSFLFYARRQWLSNISNFALKDSSSILAFLCLGWSEKTLKPFLLRVRAFLHLISILFYGLGHWKRKTNKIWNWRAGKKIWNWRAGKKKLKLARRQKKFKLDVKKRYSR